MFFKDNENKVTDFIEKNEENIANKEKKDDRLVLSASDMVDETANTIILEKNIDKIAMQDEKSAISELQDISNEKEVSSNLNEEEIDKKVEDFYNDYKKPYTSHEEYNSTGVKETIPSFENSFSRPSDIYIKNNMYAGFWSRGFAFLIDYIMVAGIKNILDYVGMTPTDTVLRELMFCIIFVLYNFVLVYLTNGYTIGKIIMGVKIVSGKKDNISFLTAFVREIAGKYILIKFPIIFFFLVFSSKKHHLIDYLSDTDVIKERYEEYFRDYQIKDEPV